MQKMSNANVLALCISLHDDQDLTKKCITSPVTGCSGMLIDDGHQVP